MAHNNVQRFNASRTITFPTAFGQLFCWRRTISNGPWCARLCVPPPTVPQGSGVSPLIEPAAKLPPPTPPGLLHVVRSRRSRGTAQARGAALTGAVLFYSRVQPGAEPLMKPFREPEAVVLRPSGALWTSQWQWLVSPSALRAFLRGCDEIPRARTLPPGSRELFPGVCLSAPASMFLLLAWNCISPKCAMPFMIYDL